MSPQDGEDQMFGPPPPESTYWAQPGPNPQPAQPSVSGTTKQGRAEFTPDPNAKNVLTQLPGLTPSLLEHGKKMAALATQNAQVPGALYEAVVVTDGEGVPQVLVQTANDEAALDEAQYSTLTASMTTSVAQAEGG
jgi:hypothetical protein